MEIQKFSIAQILREINFRDSISSKTALFALLDTDFWYILALTKLQKIIKIIIQSLQKLQNGCF